MARATSHSNQVFDVDPESLYMQLGHILTTFPAEFSDPLPRATMAWLSRAHALVLATGAQNDASELSSAMDHLVSALRFDDPAAKIMMILHRALAIAELRAPAAVQGAFIPAGNVFDALMVIGKVLQTSKLDVLIVDPFMDEKALTDFACLAACRSWFWGIFDG